MSATKTRKQVPASALQFAIDAPSLENARTADGVAVHPFTMVARTGGMADHWYWGRIVHDFGGLRVPRERIPVDYCHDYEEPVGYVDQFDTSSGSLILRGALTSVREDDRAAEIVAKAKAGVPYQASVTMDSNLLYEEVPQGQAVVVNGQSVEGPVTIFRQWTLRGVAVCLYGSDSETSVNFGHRKGGDVEVEVFQPKEETMHSEQKPAEVPAITGRDFLAAFGDLGGRWYAEGRTFAECQSLWIAELEKRLEEATKELAARNEEIAKWKSHLLGQAGGQPVSFSVAESNQQSRGRNGCENSALDRFASSLLFRRDRE